MYIITSNGPQLCFVSSISLKTFTIYLPRVLTWPICAWSLDLLSPLLPMRNPLLPISDNFRSIHTFSEVWARGQRAEDPWQQTLLLYLSICLELPALWQVPDANTLGLFGIINRLALSEFRLVIRWMNKSAPDWTVMGSGSTSTIILSLPRLQLPPTKAVR